MKTFEINTEQLKRQRNVLMEAPNTDGKIDAQSEAVLFTPDLQLLVSYKARKNDCSHFING